MISRFFISLAFFSANAQADMFQCQEHGHFVHQSWPCDAVISRSYLPPQEVEPIAIQHNSPVIDSHQPSVPSSLVSDEERLYSKHLKAIAESEPKSVIQMIKDGL